MKKPSVKGKLFSHLGHFAQQKYLVAGHNTNWQSKMVEKLTGGAPLSPDEASEMMYPKSKQEIEQDKLDKSYIDKTPSKTLDEKYIRMKEKKRLDTIG